MEERLRLELALHFTLSSVTTDHADSKELLASLAPREASLDFVEHHFHSSDGAGMKRLAVWTVRPEFEAHVLLDVDSSYAAHGAGTAWLARQVGQRGGAGLARPAEVETNERARAALYDAL